LANEGSYEAAADLTGGKLDQLQSEVKEFSENAQSYFGSASAEGMYNSLERINVLVNQLVDANQESNFKVDNKGLTGGTTTVALDKGSLDLLRDQLSATDAIREILNASKAQAEKIATKQEKDQAELQKKIEEGAKKVERAAKDKSEGGEEGGGTVPALPASGDSGVNSFIKALTGEGGDGALTKIFSGMQKGGIKGLLGSLGGVGKFMGPVGIGASAGIAAVKMYGEAMKQVNQLNQASLSNLGRKDMGAAIGMSLEDQVMGWATGLGADQIGNMRNELSGQRISYGSDNYAAAMSFSRKGMSDYGLTAAQSAKMFGDAVQRGGKSVEELEVRLKDLSKVAQETGKGMTEIMKTYEEMSKKLEKVTGDTTRAAEAATALLSMASDEKTGTGAAEGATSLMAFASGQNGELFDQKVNDLMRQNQAIGRSDAEMMTSWNMFKKGQLGGNANELLMRSGIGPEGRSLQDIIDKDDWDYLRKSFEDNTRWAQGSPRRFYELYKQVFGPVANDDISLLPDTIMELAGIEEKVLSGEDSIARVTAAGEQLGESMRSIDAQGTRKNRGRAGYSGQTGEQIVTQRFESAMKDKKSFSDFSDKEVDEFAALLHNSGALKAEDIANLSPEAKRNMLAKIYQTGADNWVDGSSFQNSFARNRDTLQRTRDIISEFNEDTSNKVNQKVLIDFGENAFSILKYRLEHLTKEEQQAYGEGASGGGT